MNEYEDVDWTGDRSYSFKFEEGSCLKEIGSNAFKFLQSEEIPLSLPEGVEYEFLDMDTLHCLVKCSHAFCAIKTCLYMLYHQTKHSPIVYDWEGPACRLPPVAKAEKTT